MQPNELPSLEVQAGPEHVTLISRGAVAATHHAMLPEDAEALGNLLWSRAGQVRGQLLTLPPRIEVALPRVEAMFCDAKENAWDLHEADRAALAVVAAEAREAARLRQQVEDLQQWLREANRQMAGTEREIQRQQGERDRAWTALGWLRDGLVHPSTEPQPRPSYELQLRRLCDAMFHQADALRSMCADRDQAEQRAAAMLDAIHRTAAHYAAQDLDALETELLNACRSADESAPLAVPPAALDEARAQLAEHRAGLLRPPHVHPTD